MLFSVIYNVLKLQTKILRNLINNEKKIDKIKHIDLQQQNNINLTLPNVINIAMDATLKFF